MSDFQGNTQDPILGQARQQVPAPESFPGKTPAMSAETVDTTKYYICTVPNGSFHRPDGMRIIFQHNFLETKLKATQDYLDTEILFGHEYLRQATQQEIDLAHMKIDPMGTMREKVKAEIEGELRVKLEAEIMARIGMKQGELPQSTLSEEFTKQSDTPSDVLGARRIQGTDIMDKLRDARQSLKVPGATLVNVSEGSKLQGIVGSDKLVGGAADSSSTTGTGGVV